MVAASPCALAIAVPVTVVAAIGAASRIGALVKGGAALEGLGAIRTLALDKTGTLTRNTPTDIDVAAHGAGQHERVKAQNRAVAQNHRRGVDDDRRLRAPAAPPSTTTGALGAPMGAGARLAQPARATTIGK